MPHAGLHAREVPAADAAVTVELNGLWRAAQPLGDTAHAKGALLLTRSIAGTPPGSLAARRPELPADASPGSA